ncbi:MAG: M56 family metallopeptidase [Verrucomicrobiales bacterium]|jgi:beta-lactamase regulating signal transducer with metallopeptidase domain|nr:M56 family metallopeptidase [Verrucomicrobiales bacterium]
MNFSTPFAIYLRLQGYYPHLTAVFDFLLKSALIFVFALLVARLLKQRSALARNWLWRISLLAFLLLPIWPLASIYIHYPKSINGMNLEAHPVPRVPLITVSSYSDIPEKLHLINSYREAQRIAMPDRAPWESWDINANMDAYRPLPLRWLERMVLPAWLAVSVLSLLGHWIKRRHAMKWLDKNQLPAPANIRAVANKYLGANGEVALHPGVHSPLLIKSGHAKIFLPVAAKNWPDTVLRSVLLHEAAHLKRRDLFWLAFANFAMSVWWWNPFVRRAVRHMACEAEQAADDAVILANCPNTDYAETLVELAANDDLQIGIPFTGKQSLEQRIRSLLATNPWRGKTGKLAAAFLVIVSVVSLVVISSTVGWQMPDLVKIDKIPPPIEMSKEQQQSVEQALQSLKTRLTAQRYLHFKIDWSREVTTDGKSSNIHPDTGSVEVWIDEWKKVYYSKNSYQQTYLNNGRYIYSIDFSNQFYRQEDSDRITGLEVQYLGKYEEQYMTLLLQSHFDSIGKRIINDDKKEIGSINWHAQSMFSFHVSGQPYYDGTPNEKTYILNPAKNYEFTALLSNGKAEWELLESGTDANGHFYPKQYRTTRNWREKHEITVQNFHVTLFEVLNELPEKLLNLPTGLTLEKPAKINVNWSKFVASPDPETLKKISSVPEFPQLPTMVIVPANSKP